MRAGHELCSLQHAPRPRGAVIRGRARLAPALLDAVLQSAAGVSATLDATLLAKHTSSWRRVSLLPGLAERGPLATAPVPQLLTVHRGLRGHYTD